MIGCHCLLIPSWIIMKKTVETDDTDWFSGRSTMDFKELSYVLAIAQYHSITKAANSLYLSQPTLTKFLQQLEGSLNQKLFDRVGKKMVLTYAGERYVARATEILNIKKDLDQELGNIAQGKAGTLRVGLSSVRGSEIILNVVPAFLKRYPQIQLKFQEIDVNSFETALLSGNLDIVFYNLPIQSPNIDYQLVAYEEIILVTAQDHPLTKLAQILPHCRYPWVDLRWVQNETFIMLSSELRLHLIVNSLFEKAGFVPNISFYTKNVEAACILASEGYGLAFSGEQYIKHLKFDHRPAMFSVGNPCTRRTFVAATRKGAYLPSYAQDFIDLAKSNPNL